MAKHEIIDVRVSRRVLWIGAEAYPLHNIARATTVRIEPDRWGAAARFMRSLIVLVILAFTAVVVIEATDFVEAAGWPGIDREDALNGLTLAVVGIVAVFALRLISVLLTRTYHALVIETAGTPRTALVSTDRNLVVSLVYQIMNAIDDPQASFSVKVDNYHIGDKISMIGGDRNVGKVSH